MFEDLLAFVNKMQEKGVTIFISFPGIENNSSIKLLGNPKDYVFPTEETYDIPYHLRYDGVEKRTNTLIHFLKEKLKQNKDLLLDQDKIEAVRMGD